MQTESCVSSSLHSLPSKMLTFCSLIWEDCYGSTLWVWRIVVVTDHQKYRNCVVVNKVWSIYNKTLRLVRLSASWNSEGCVQGLTLQIFCCCWCFFLLSSSSSSSPAFLLLWCKWWYVIVHDMIHHMLSEVLALVKSHILVLWMRYESSSYQTASIVKNVWPQCGVLLLKVCNHLVCYMMSLCKKPEYEVNIIMKFSN